MTAPPAHTAINRGGGWGGVRANAGRRRKQGRSNVPHRRRAPHYAEWPALITLRTRWRSLRTQFVFPTIRWAIAAANRKWARGAGAAGAFFRICHFSIQGTHVHLIVEASSGVVLERAVRGFSIRLAKQLNRLIFRKGPLLADRYHSLELKTARSVRNALVYVLANFRKHGHGRDGEAVDPYSSAPYFLGFVESDELTLLRTRALHGPAHRIQTPNVSLDPRSSSPVIDPGSWLLSRGWLQHGRISVWERPQPSGA